MRVKLLGPMIVTAGLAAAARPAPAQPVTAADYARARQFLPANAMKLVRNTNIIPHWTGDGEQFWYQRESTDGAEIVLVDPSANTRVDGVDRASLPPDPPTGAAHEVLSPDGRWAAFVSGYDLWVREVATGSTFPLSTDGTEDFAYGGRGEAFQGAATARRLGIRLPPVIVWSPDSRRLIAQRVDQREVGELYMVESVPREGHRPRVYPYRMPFSADEHVPLAHLVIFDVEARQQIAVQADPLYILHVSPIDFRLVWWSDDASRIYFVREERGAKALSLFEVDPATGATRRMLEERSDTYAEIYLDIYNKLPTVRILDGGKEVLWYSERDGWAHLYLYDGATGRMIRQITSGEFVVRDVLHVDEAARRVYFVAGGREPDRNPYYRFLYRIGLDGKGLALLTPENADHRVTISPSGRYFVDRYSRADTVPVMVVRRTDGTLVRRLETGDVSRLQALGWRWPEPFHAKARDGTTEVYGRIYRPTNFDPNRRYPVIDDIYPGPQTIRTLTGFPLNAFIEPSFYWNPQATAELGFIVVTVDGMGTPWRNKAFHDFSYRNLGDAGGLDDHIAAIRQLAGRYPYLDTTRVGIYGNSSGGYATIRAMLTRPDFYRVGVAGVPYIGPSAIVAWWSDRYQGYPVDTANYRASDLAPLAGNLKGKLMIALGGVDENADPFLVMPLIDAFVKADKDFDLVLVPNAPHAASGHPYVVRRRWDYFVRHLLGVDPASGRSAAGTPNR